ncbi:MAG: hypothetical protein MI750_06405 [Xanthomonadales bacterium]|nr:hypothetical protein [Xanthomonadales bacterium]
MHKETNKFTVIACLLAVLVVNALSFSSALAGSDKALSVNEVDSAVSYEQLLEKIGDGSARPDYNQLWRAYYESDSFKHVVFSAADYELLTEDIIGSEERCQNDMLSSKKTRNEQFLFLSYHHALLKCAALLGDEKKAQMHEHFIEQLSAHMLSKGDGNSERSAIWVGSVYDAHYFMRLNGFDVVDESLRYEEESKNVYYYLYYLDDRQNRSELIFNPREYLDKVANILALKEAGDDPVLAKLWLNDAVLSEALSYLVAQGNATAMKAIGDAMILEDPSLINEVLVIYDAAANLGSSEAAYNYATFTLDQKLEENYEYAAELLIGSVEAKSETVIALLVTMYELELGLKKDQEIIDSLLDITKPKNNDGNIDALIGSLILKFASKLDHVHLANGYLKRAIENGNQVASSVYANMLMISNPSKESFLQALQFIRDIVEEGGIEVASKTLNRITQLPGVMEHKFGGSMELITTYTLLAEHGDSQSALKLAESYKEGRGVEVDLAKAAQYYKHAADASNPEAAYKVGMMLLEGRDLEQDTVQAAHYLEIAANHNHGAAMNVLGSIYEQGLSGAKNLAVARDWYFRAMEQDYLLGEVNYLIIDYRELSPYIEQAGLVETLLDQVEQGYPEAMTALAVLHRRGFLVDKDPERRTELLEAAMDKDFAPAFYLSSVSQLKFASMLRSSGGKHRKRMEKAAEQNMPEAFVALGNHYYTLGLSGSSRGWRKAIAQFRLATKSSRSDHWVLSGKIYEDGLGVDQDYDQALHYYQLAADKGNTVGVNKIAELGLRDASSESTALAINYLQQTAEQGSYSAMRQLSRIYGSDRYRLKDFEKYVHWLRKASANGDPSAGRELGILLMTDQQRRPSPNMAHLYISESTPDKQGEHYFWLARTLALGNYAEESKQEISDYYQQAIAQEHLSAMNNYAVLVLNGVLQGDKGDAFDLLDDASDEGNISATYNKAWCYEHGLGTKQRLRKAIRYYEKAAEKGSVRAMKRLEYLFSDTESKYYDEDEIAELALLISATKANTQDEIVHNYLN